MCTTPCNTFFFSFFLVFTGLAIFISFYLFVIVFNRLGCLGLLTLRRSCIPLHKSLWALFRSIARLRMDARSLSFDSASAKIRYAVFFLAIGPVFLPRLVLAFVFVLCPLAGSLRLWRIPLYELISESLLMFRVSSLLRSPSMW